MHDSTASEPPVLTLEAEPVSDDAAPKPRDGIVVSTVLRLTTSDGQRFEDIPKAMEHEAFYQILKRLVKELNWADNEETAVFATTLAKHFRSLVPLLNRLESDAEALRGHLARYRPAPHE
jgi:hypothetical protein